jgi:hypothetical protein
MNFIAYLIIFWMVYFLVVLYRELKPNKPEDKIKLVFYAGLKGYTRGFYVYAINKRTQNKIFIRDALCENMWFQYGTDAEMFKSRIELAGNNFKAIQDMYSNYILSTLNK